MAYLHAECGNPSGRTAGGCVASIRMAHGGRDGQWIKCDPSGHCQWTARTSVAAARRRIYELSRGPVPNGSELKNTCGDPRCVNLDHLKIRRAPAASLQTCVRGHEVTAKSVVRHRDGRIAYCRLCRNAKRRERYQSDSGFALREVERQRGLRRRRTAKTS